MKIIQICKRINNDESGANRNHDHFIDLPNVDADMLIFESKEDIDFIDKRDGEIINLSLFRNRNWVKKLRYYYEKYDLKAGDEVTLERRIHNDGEEEFFIDHIKYGGIVFQKKSFYNEYYDQTFQAFECLKGDIDFFNDKYGDLITINSLGSFKRNKRKKTKNGQDEQEYYYECFEIIQNDKNIIDNYKVNDLIEIRVVNDKANVSFINRGIVYEMEV